LSICHNREYLKMKDLLLYFGPQRNEPCSSFHEFHRAPHDFQDYTAYRFHVKPKIGKWLTVVLIIPEEFGGNREQVRLALEAENIEARLVWKPMHVQPVFRVDKQSVKGKGHGGKKIYRARPSEIRSAVVNKFHKARVVGGDV